MKVKRYFAPDMRQAIKLVRDELGDDAVILSNRRVAGGVEVVSAIDYEGSVAEMKMKKEAKPQQSAAARYSDVKRELLHSQIQLNQPHQLHNNNVNGVVSDQQLNHSYVVQSGVKQQNTFFDAKKTVRPSALDEVKSELNNIRELLYQQLSGANDDKHDMYTPLQKVMQKRLLQAGFTEKVSNQFIDGLRVETNMDIAWHLVLSQLAQNIPVCDENIVDNERIIALVGPTGVGKTTTLGKLAARFALQHGSDQVAMITTDTYRVAAQEQLRTFSRILNVPLKVVDSQTSLQETLRNLRDKKRILIDTAGFHHHDQGLIEQLEMLNSSSRQIKTLLLLSCTSQSHVLQAVVNAYRSPNLLGCILTKMDESESLGEILSVVIAAQLPVAYVSEGQRVPHDLRNGSAHSLLSRAIACHQLEEVANSSNTLHAIDALAVS